MNRFTLIPIFLSLALLATPEGAARQIAFHDASATAGIVTQAAGYGAAVADYDRDGWVDVFLTTGDGPSSLFRNNGDGTFTDVAFDAGVAVLGWHTAAVWGDVDNDGHPDLFIGGDHRGQSGLFRNLGDGTFDNITRQLGLDPNADVASAAFADADLDGRLDLFIAIDRGPDLFFHNQSTDATITFADVTAAVGLAGDAHTVAMQATWFDYDHDGDPDLFAVHDGTSPSRLYRNDGNLRFRDVAHSAGIDTYPAGVCCNMGIAWGDADGDGWEDPYVTRIGLGGLYRNLGDGRFVDEAEPRKAGFNGMSWGVVYADFDLDGDSDLFVASTYGYSRTPSLLYENLGGTFRSVARRAGAEFNLESYGTTFADFNNDGRPDLFVPSLDGQHKLLMNESQGGNGVTVRLEGLTANRMAIGARVVIRAGGLTLTRTVSGGDSFCSQQSPILHFGLGTSATRIDSLQIFWGGKGMETHTNLAVNGHYAFRQQASATTVDPPTGVPSTLRLDQNYPNPFRQHTTFRFHLPHEGSATLEVVDMLGRIVATPLRAFMPSGTHEVLYDASMLPSGLYIYRLTTGEHRRVRSFLVLR